MLIEILFVCVIVLAVLLCKEIKKKKERETAIRKKIQNNYNEVEKQYELADKELADLFTTTITSLDEETKENFKSIGKNFDR